MLLVIRFWIPTCEKVGIPSDKIVFFSEVKILGTDDH